MIGRRNSKKWVIFIVCGLILYIIISSVGVKDGTVTQTDTADVAREHDMHENVNRQEEIGRADSGQNQQITAVKIPHLYFGDEGHDTNGGGVEINRNVLSLEDKKLFDEGYERHDFNEYISNLISVDRRAQEARDPRCLNVTYQDDLPDTSVIICFLNEAFSVLVRSVHSVINTTPSHLLKEIVLVDDYSDYENLKAPLDAYMRRFPKVTIVRNTQREGLIRSRLNGAAVATGQVLTFLDSHIECTEGWLPPLLARIKENASHAVWPTIPFIDRHTFKFLVNRNARDLSVGVFDWHMYFHWHHVPDEERGSLIAPIRSPVMAGGLFSIDRAFFYHIGGYDDGMRFWGAENIDLSLRIWMCGGTLELIPCSVVGHVFRERNVNSNAINNGAVIRNAKRTVAVWLDEYREVYEVATGNKLEHYGDVSKRIELRQKLKCKSFQWYIENVYPTIFLPHKAKLSGLVHSGHDTSLCLQAVNFNRSPVTVGVCNKNEYQTQVFYVTEWEEIRLLSYCLDGADGKPLMYPCFRMGGNQKILYREDQTIFSVSYNKCLQLTENIDGVELAPCNGGLRQVWQWETVPLDFLSHVV